MKKIVSLMIVSVVIVTAAFASDFNINFGLGCGINSGKQVECDCGRLPEMTNEPKFGAAGFDIQLGFNIELDNHFVIYDSLNFVVPGCLKRGNNGEDRKKISGIDSKLLISDDVGAGYAFHFNAIRILLGGGLHLDYLTYKYEEKDDHDSDPCRNVNFGLNFFIHGNYFFSERFGAFVGIEPTVNFYNSWKDGSVSGEDAKRNGTALGFHGSFVAGATYRI